MNAGKGDPKTLAALLTELVEFETALVANTIGSLDPTPSHHFYMGGSIASLTPLLGPTVGVAVTCRVDSSTPDTHPAMDLYWKLLETIEAIEAPVVLVAKAAGSRPDHECIIGDGTLASVGCVGIVTDGGVRDIEGILTILFAVYARGRTIHNTALRFSELNQPVEIGGITVNPGDVIHANIGGVIKVPHACLEQLPERCTAMRACEHDIHRVWRQKGISVAEKISSADAIAARYGFV